MSLILSPNMPRDYLRELPLEVRCEIFSFLSSDELVRYLFVSKYFFDTIKYGPGSVPTVTIPINNISTCSRAEFNLYLNIFSNNSSRPIQKLKLQSGSSRDYDESVLDVLSKYLINRLYVSDKCDILPVLEERGPFLSLIELKFGLDCPLNFNKLKPLLHITPNLQSLKIDIYFGLDPELYTGTAPFDNLSYLRIYNNKFLPHSATQLTPEAILSSFVKLTPNLTHLALLGTFFQLDFDPGLKFLESLNYLQSIAIDTNPRPRSFVDATFLLPIKEGKTKLTELILQANCVHAIPQQLPLDNIETFYFTGWGFVHALQYYGIGTNLKRLYLRAFEARSTEEIITLACKQCSNIEELVVSWFPASVEWLVHISTTLCKRLEIVCFDSIVKIEDISSLSKVKNIKDIYLLKKLDPISTELLTNYGFSVYNECSYIFSTLHTTPYEDDIGI